MKRRQVLLAGMGAGVLVLPMPGLAQPRTQVPVIGFLVAETPGGQEGRIEALRGALREMGYVEGRNIAIETRSAIGDYDRLPGLAAELVRLKVDVLVAFGSKAAFAASGATKSIPIVVPVLSDPIAVGLSGSLARPSGNLTGSATFGIVLVGKRLELLKAVAPRVARVGLLVNSANAASASQAWHQAVRVAADRLRVDTRTFAVRSHEDLPGAFGSMAKGRIDAVYVSSDTLFQAAAIQLAELALRQRLPSAGSKEFAEAGGLVGYGANDRELYVRGAYFIDRLLKGSKPADLPIEQATRFELVVNRRTAKALGLALPQEVALRADRVIE